MVTQLKVAEHLCDTPPRLLLLSLVITTLHSSCKSGYEPYFGGIVFWWVPIQQWPFREQTSFLGKPSTSNKYLTYGTQPLSNCFVICAGSKAAAICDKDIHIAKHPSTLLVSTINVHMSYNSFDQNIVSSLWSRCCTQCDLLLLDMQYKLTSLMEYTSTLIVTRGPYRVFMARLLLRVYPKTFPYAGFVNKTEWWF